MKEIDEDTTNDAIEIFFSLNDEELTEDINNLRREQKQIYDLTNSAAKKSFRAGEQRRMVWRISLIIDHCFNTYYQEMPVISYQVVLKQMNIIEKEERTQRRDKGGFDIKKTIDDSGQKDLVEKIIIKAYLFSKGKKILNENELYHLNLLIIVLVLIYQTETIRMNKIKKQ
jgi:hypothetical protein